MKIKMGKLSHTSKRVKPWMYISALLINVLVFIFIASVYSSSNRSYNKKLFNENIKNVETLNAASANAAFTYTDSMGVKVNDIVNYINTSKLSYEAAVSYLCTSNTNPDRQLQLILSGSFGDTGKLSFGDYSGISIRTVRKDDGTFETVKKDIDYKSGYYDILTSFTDVNDESLHGVCVAPEFTDPDTKLKCFAVYHHLNLEDNSGKKSLYTILLAVNSETALNSYDMQSEYIGQSSVLVNADGNYIIKNSDYRNVNFYDYIVNYNGLTLDRREQLHTMIIKETAQTGSPVNLFYKNHQGVDCVFSVVAIENGWYSITCVPLSSFNFEKSTVDYSLIIVILFLLLFLIDGVAIYFIGKAMSHNIAIAEQASMEAINASKSKSRFLSTMSHELRTPLNAIIGLVALSGDSLNDKTVLKDYLKKIDISSKLLLQLISDILDVSAIESNKLKLNESEFDITKLITSLSAIYYDQCAAKGITFNVALKNMHSETLIGDSVRLNQVLLNFLSNAVKFTPRGGNVTLSAEQIDKTNDSIVVRFTVSDTGCGISDELKTRIFLPFERENGESARKYSGTGLGLSIAKNLVELMNGHIGIESTEGVGSSFWAEISFSVRSERELRSFSQINKMRVLAAIKSDDEREYIGQILSGFGIERTLVSTAESVLDLLTDAKKQEKPFNMCILDWKMSDLNGMDASKKIRKHFDSDELHIIILAYNLAEASSICASCGADMVFGKPVFPSTLYNILEESSSGYTKLFTQTTQDYALTGKKILLIEDNALNTEIARLLLTKVGAEVETAENGQIGVDVFNASPQGYFDAILMDIQMPVMDGYQATLEIRAGKHPQASSIPILAMTADAFAEDVEKSLQAGMNEHIAKPIVPETLYLILKKHINE